MNVLTAAIAAEGDRTEMTTENAETTDTAAAVAEQGANVAPEKASPKKGASTKKSAPKGQKSAKGGKAKPSATPKPKKASPAKKATKGPKQTAKAKESAGLREGSKTAQVVAMLQRKNGATLAEIMEKMGWQKHTVRGFMAGAMKKAGYTVESFKPEGGERTYRLNP
jgi:hypothetical protein